jgi:hypothetical protein
MFQKLTKVDVIALVVIVLLIVMNVVIWSIVKYTEGIIP